MKKKEFNLKCSTWSSDHFFIPTISHGAHRENDSLNVTARFQRILKGLTNHIPRPFKRKLRWALSYPAIFMGLVMNFTYDFTRFWRWSSSSGGQLKESQLQAWIIADYHKIEKALALRDPRPGFGTAIVNRLLDNLESYALNHGINRTWHVARNVLFAYQEFHARRGYDIGELDRRILQLSTAKEHSNQSKPDGGVDHLSRGEILAKSKVDLREFFASRHSIRHFSTEPVEFSTIEEAVRMAQKTPTVCNRQSPKVYAYADQADRKKVLSCQMGNSGFGDQAAVVLVVTSDIQTFFSAGERNQCWIDGGLFSMSLIYALHSLGLGSCCLNWSVERKHDIQLRNVTGIPESESIIMLIAVGHLPSNLRVAQSPRKPLSEVLYAKRTV